MGLKLIFKIFLSTLLVVLTSFSVMAQNRNVRGTVFEPDGTTPIPGATVVLKGTTTGTITSMDGEYQITVSGANPILVVQFLGFISQEASVDNRSVINFVMEEESIALDDVVVTHLA